MRIITAKMNDPAVIDLTSVSPYLKNHDFRHARNSGFYL
jgi:hypothetical protein